MRYFALILSCSLVLVSCGGGGGGGGGPNPNPCDGVEVTLVIEHFLPPVQNGGQLLPFQGGWWGITQNGAPTTGGTVFLRNPSGAVTPLAINPQDTGKYFTPDVAGTWEMWGESNSGCTTKTETFFVFPYTIEMVFGEKFVPGGQDWGIADAFSSQGISGTSSHPVMLTFFDAVGNLMDIVEIDNGTLKFYTPNQNIIGVGFVVGMTSNGDVTPIRQFNLVDPGCDIGVDFPGFILPKGLPQQIDIQLFGASSHSGGHYTIRHEGELVGQPTGLSSNATSFSWTPPYDGAFTIELDLALPCGSRSSLPYPVMVQ